MTSEETSGKEDIELLRKVRRLWAQTRLIILAGESTTTDVITAMEEHAFGHFSLPFSLDELHRLIRIAAGGADWDDGGEVVCAAEQRIRLNVRCDLDTADRVLKFLEEMEALPDPETNDLAAASREVLCNAIENGGNLIQQTTFFWKREHFALTRQRRARTRSVLLTPGI